MPRWVKRRSTKSGNWQNPLTEKRQQSYMTPSREHFERNVSRGRTLAKRTASKRRVRICGTSTLRTLLVAASHKGAVLRESNSDKQPRYQFRRTRVRYLQLLADA